MCGCLLPLLGTWPTTQARALTGNQTSDPLVRRLALNPLSHTSHSYSYFSYKNFIVLVLIFKSMMYFELLFLSCGFMSFISFAKLLANMPTNIVSASLSLFLGLQLQVCLIYSLCPSCLLSSIASVVCFS